MTPDVVFATLGVDGRVKALWGDGELVVLSPSGAAFVHVPPQPPPPSTQQQQQQQQDRLSSPSPPRQPPSKPRPANPCQRAMRQLSDFALSRAQPALAAALRFRNLHADAPAYCAHLATLARGAGDAFALGYPITRVYWPPTPAAAAAAGLVELLDRSRVAVRSACGAARLVLDAATRARFAVCYPLLLRRGGGGGREDDSSSSGGNGGGGDGAAGAAAAAAHVHVWQTSVFSARACPARWTPALALAEAVADGAGAGFAAALRLAGDGFGCSSSPRCHRNNSPGSGSGNDELHATTMPPPMSPAATAAATDSLELRPSDAVTELPRVLWPDYANGAPGAAAAEAAALEPCYEPDSWWLEPGTHLPPNASQLAVVWTPEAAFWLLHGCNTGGGEVEAALHADDSLLATDGPATVRHALPGEARARVYAEGAVPDAVTARATGGRVAVGAAAARALKLRAMLAAAAASARRRGGARSPSSLLPSALQTLAPGAAPPALASPLDAAASTELKQAASAAGVGNFYAYADGRVRAVFDDRTVLNLGPDRRAAALVLPDGARRAVNASNPVGAERYVGAALEFAAWAFAAPAAREAALRTRARIEAELASTARMAAICAYGAARATPPLPLRRASPASPGQTAFDATGERAGKWPHLLPLPLPAAEGGCRGAAAADPAVRARLVEAMLARNAELLERL